MRRRAVATRAPSSSASPATPASSRCSSSPPAAGIAERRALRVRRRSSADLRARRLHAQHHHARLRRRQPADRRVRHPAARGRRLRRHQPAAAPGDHRDRGHRVRPPFRHQHLAHRRGGDHRHHRDAARAGRQHADAAAGAQPQGAVRADVQKRGDLFRLPRAEDEGADPRDPDREALHQARDLHDLLQPDVPRARRLRRRGRVAPVLRQVEQGADARGGGAHRRHLPDARAAEPVRRHEARDAAAQHRAAAHGRRAATSRRRRPTPPRRSRS